MNLTLQIDIPDDQVAEFARLVAAHLAGIGHPTAPPPRPDRAGHPPDGPPTDGRTLLGWSDRHGLRSAVLRFGRGRKYPSKVLSWSREQVQDCFHELSAKPPKGSQDWGRTTSAKV